MLNPFQGLRKLLGLSNVNHELGQRTDPQIHFTAEGNEVDKSFRDWVDLPQDELRPMLIALIGHNFGPDPEKCIPEIRESRRNYTNYIADKCKIKKKTALLIWDLAAGLVHIGSRKEQSMYMHAT